MSPIETILHSNVKPKEKQIRLVEMVVSGGIPVEKLMAYFETARDVDKGACADAMKQISALRPELLAPYMDTLIGHINDRLPRVRWGVPETIGFLAKDYPVIAAKAIPNLLKNTGDDPTNTTVIRWCAAFALVEITKYNPAAREELFPVFARLVESEHNNGVRNLYARALKSS